MRPIDADALKAILERYRECNSALVDDYSEGKFEAYSLSIAEINDAPTIEPDRPKGEWVKFELGNILDPQYKCPVCGDVFNPIVPYNFCPNCGADMRKEGE